MSRRENNEALWGELNGQTARIQWPDLERFFARGQVVNVAPELDLVEVAIALARDDADEMESMITAGKIARATDDHARKWNECNPELWAVVVAPWVLVQERLPGSTTSR